MAEESGKLIQGVRTKVYVSGPDGVPMVDVIALSLERGLGMKGSSIQHQLGRWDSKTEPGHVIEITCDWMNESQVAENVEAELRPFVDSLGLTFYVTIETVKCMEVF